MEVTKDTGVVVWPPSGWLVAVAEVVTAAVVVVVVDGVPNLSEAVGCDANNDGVTAEDTAATPDASVDVAGKPKPVKVGAVELLAGTDVVAVGRVKLDFWLATESR